MDLMSTIAGSMLDGFFPVGWDLQRIDECCSQPPESITERQSWWHQNFSPVPCKTVEDFEVMMGHEIAQVIAQTHRDGQPLAMILPVGPMGMYRWAVYFLKEWNVTCHHVYGFNMDEWSDAAGNTLPGNAPGGFQNAMEGAFYGPLGNATVPVNQRHFATADTLPTYAGKIAELKQRGAKLVTVYGIGRVMHIAFWEPHFAAEFLDDGEWAAQTHRIGARLHPLTIEQNAITSFRSRTTLVPAFANTIGPGLFLQSDWCIGGADGTLGRGMMWQGLSLWTTLRYGKSPWIPSSYMPTMPGRLFFHEELAGPLLADCN